MQLEDPEGPNSQRARLSAVRPRGRRACGRADRRVHRGALGTHTTWHRVAPLLAERHTVVCPDLRGHGGSTGPAPAPDHAPHSKRAMAADGVELMRALRHDRFAVVGHDRGSYVAYRLAFHHPEAVTALAVLDCVPIGEALARCNARVAQAWYHWLSLAQPERPERLINADPDGWYEVGVADDADRAAGPSPRGRGGTGGTCPRLTRLPSRRWRG
ncbi:alpha/beta fold hydrolase [Jiangella aurantiaca]|uniref:Alpha/beta fold hydrolase n=1 Tax=Jiangella aurantiaca TaxID=2530373 RepID=A0A4R5A1V2_9ACTN|nr:alpha/beta fold hydrolase [Jiangella aurantiaca]TDD64489.1 alpha/beta fold hydrolase [Jiangella aurantiaca]